MVIADKAINPAFFMACFRLMSGVVFSSGCQQSGNFSSSSSLGGSFFDYVWMSCFCVRKSKETTNHINIGMTSAKLGVAGIGDHPKRKFNRPKRTYFLQNSLIESNEMSNNYCILALHFQCSNANSLFGSWLNLSFNLNDSWYVSGDFFAGSGFCELLLGHCAPGR
jgi:hypothetical protein